MSTPTPVKLSRPCMGAKVLLVLLVLPVLLPALVLPTAAAPLRMATEAYVTNTVASATNALSAALSAAIPTNNAQLANGAGYVTASVTNGLLKTETDPRFTAWADVQTDADGIVYYSLGSGYAYKLRSSFSAKDLYSAEIGRAHV